MSAGARFWDRRATNLNACARAASTRKSSAPRSGLRVSGAPSVPDYFGTPTNRAPVNLPSSLMSGA